MNSIFVRDPLEFPTAGNVVRAFTLRFCLLGLFALVPPSSGRTEDTAQPRPVEVEANQPPPVDRSALIAQGRGHPSYQVFSHQANLPTMEVLGKQKLAVGGFVRIDVSNLRRLSPADKQTLGALLGIPLSVVQTVVDVAQSQTGCDATQFKQQLCAATIDYKYLRDRWTHYRPPAG